MSHIRLRQSRLAKGLSLQESADGLARLGLKISRAALHKHEAGTSRPSARVLLKLAALYSVSAHDLLNEPTIVVEWLAFRRHASLPRKQAERVMAFAGRRAEQQISLAKTLGQAATKFPRRQHVASLIDAEQLATNVRRAWGLGDAPIESMAGTIEDNGGVVVEVLGAPHGFDGLSGLAAGCHPVVVVNGEAPADRRRYTLAHELGHVVMTCDDVPTAAQEPLAHRYAAAFLVPSRIALRELGEKRRHLDLQELKLLKARYGLSIQAWIRRAYDLEIITQGTYRSLCKQVGALGWRRTEPVVYDAERRPSRLRQLVLHAMAEGVLSQTEGAEFLREFGGSRERLGSTGASAMALLLGSEEERDRVLALAAEAAAPDYIDGGALRGFDAFGEKDLHDDDAEG